MTTPRLPPRAPAHGACPATGLAAAETGGPDAVVPDSVSPDSVSPDSVSPDSVSPEIACDAACPRARTAPRRVSEVCADDAARLALAVARYLAAARETREADCFEAAFAEAEAALPADVAGLFVGAMGGMVRAFEAQAGRAPKVLPASCCRATADEEALVGLLARARGGALAPEGRLARAALAAARLLAPAHA